jgi:hypothetical protein
MHKRKRLTLGSDVGLTVAADAAKTLPLAPRVQPPAAPLAQREALLLPPCWLADLPVPTTLQLAALHGPAFRVTTSRAHYTAQREAGQLVLRGSELGALAIAAENGRASGLWLAEWLAKRADDPTMQLTPEVALGGISCPETPSSRWSLDSVLHAWSLWLTGVGVGDGPDWL